MLSVGDGYLYMSLCDAALCQLECVYGSGMAFGWRGCRRRSGVTNVYVTTATTQI